LGRGQSYTVPAIELQQMLVEGRIIQGFFPSEQRSANGDHRIEMIPGYIRPGNYRRQYQCRQGFPIVVVRFAWIIEMDP
jgi:hypothetical protein